MVLGMAKKEGAGAPAEEAAAVLEAAMKGGNGTIARRLAQRRRQGEEARKEEEGKARGEEARAVAAAAVRPADGTKALASLTPEEREALGRALGAHYVAVDCDRPDALCVSIDPPVLVFPDFFPEEDCDALAHAAVASGRMQQSGVGEGHAAEAATSARRTSRTMLVDADASGDMHELAAALQERVEELLEGVEAWGAPGKAPPSPRHHSMEPLQVCAYADGQQFKAHEDAFPDSYARSCGFNRSATALLYLNDGEGKAGGETAFLALGGDEVRVTPTKGSLVLFFPGRRDGAAWRADPRTLHCARPTDGAWEKFVAQQWVAVGAV